MGFTKQSRPIQPRWLEKNEEKVRFDLCIQRNEVWDLDKKSLFIHSIICDYPIPPFFAQDSDDEYLWILDGKQRLTTLIKFMKNEFALSENTPPVENVEIEGLKYEELPKDFQDEIRTRNLLLYTFKNLTDDERDEIFLRLNYGVALSKMELNRVAASSRIMSIIQEIAKEPFFNENISITANQRNRFIDEELLLQIFMLLMKEEGTGLASKDISEFVLELKDQGIPGDKLEIVKNTTKYLNEALPVKEKFLKKINVPMIFMMATKAIKEEVDPVKFGGWVQSFYKDIPLRYKDACSAGSAKKENVMRRLEEIEKHYDQNIATAPDYEVPQPKQTTGKRGRPRKSEAKPSVITESISQGLEEPQVTA